MNREGLVTGGPNGSNRTWGNCYKLWHFTYGNWEKLELCAVYLGHYWNDIFTHRSYPPHRLSFPYWFPLSNSADWKEKKNVQLSSEQPQWRTDLKGRFERVWQNYKAVKIVSLSSKQSSRYSRRLTYIDLLIRSFIDKLRTAHKFQMTIKRYVSYFNWQITSPCITNCRNCFGFWSCRRGDFTDIMM